MWHFQAAAPAFPGSVGAVEVSLPKRRRAEEQGQTEMSSKETKQFRHREFSYSFFVKCVELITKGIGTKNS